MSCHCDCRPSCPYVEWLHPLCCNPAHFCCAGCENGPTLVIHKIVLEPCGGQSCTERTFTLRITGPSYPNGETFTLRAGSCTQLDEPLVISGLEPGCYTIEELMSKPYEYCTTITGPVMGNVVRLTNSGVPTVVTIVSRKQPPSGGESLFYRMENFIIYIAASPCSVAITRRSCSVSPLFALTKTQ